MQSSSKHNDRPSNDHYETDIRYTFDLCHWILKPIGMYPLIFNRTSKYERIASVLLILLCCSILQFVIVPFGNHMLFTEKDMNTFVKYLGPLTFSLSTFFKYCYFGTKGTAIGRCVKHVERDWKMLQDKNHRMIMIRHVTISRNLIKLCAVFLYTGGLSYHTIIPLLSKKNINVNVTFRPLTYPGYENFFDVQKSPAYEIVYCMHCVYVLVTGNITMAAYSLTTIFATHACGQIKIQTTRLENLTKGEKLLEKVVKDRLAVIVSGHVQILKFMRSIESALHEMFLIEIIVSTALLCLLEYLCMMEWESSDAIAILTYVGLLISFTFNILIYCYVGELLLGQGSEIAYASYNTEWYNLPRRKSRDIVLLLAISKYPIRLTAGKIFVLSLNTFGAVLKSSIVYLNMLRTVTEF
ncbi:Odorant receptor 13a [Anthophora retusa]